MVRGMLPKIGQQPTHRAQVASPGAPNQSFRNFDVRRGRARHLRKPNEAVIEADKAFFDLLLRRGDHGMGETFAELHRHEGDDFQGLARAGRLLDQDMAVAPAHIGYRSRLVGTKRFA